MNCLQKRKLYRGCRYIRRHAKNFIIKTLCVVNSFSLLFWMCLIDSIISWQLILYSFTLWLMRMGGYMEQNSIFSGWRKKVNRNELDLYSVKRKRWQVVRSCN